MLVFLKKITSGSGFSVVLPAAVKSSYSLSETDYVMFTISSKEPGHPVVFCRGEQVGDLSEDTAIQIQQSDLTTVENDTENLGNNKIYDYTISVFQNYSGEGVKNVKLYLQCSIITTNVFSLGNNLNTAIFYYNGGIFTGEHDVPEGENVPEDEYVTYYFVGIEGVAVPKYIVNPENVNIYGYDYELQELDENTYLVFETNKLNPSTSSAFQLEYESDSSRFIIPEDAIRNNALNFTAKLGEPWKYNLQLGWLKQTFANTDEDALNGNFRYPVSYNFNYGICGQMDYSTEDKSSLYEKGQTITNSIKYGRDDEQYGISINTTDVPPKTAIFEKTFDLAKQALQGTSDTEFEFLNKDYYDQYEIQGFEIEKIIHTDNTSTEYLEYIWETPCERPDADPIWHKELSCQRFNIIFNSDDISTFLNKLSTKSSKFSQFINGNPIIGDGDTIIMNAIYKAKEYNIDFEFPRQTNSFSFVFTNEFSSGNYVAEEPALTFRKYNLSNGEVYNPNTGTFIDYKQLLNGNYLLRQTAIASWVQDDMPYILGGFTTNDDFKNQKFILDEQTLEDITQSEGVFFNFSNETSENQITHPYSKTMFSSNADTTLYPFWLKGTLIKIQFWFDGNPKTDENIPDRIPIANNFQNSIHYPQISFPGVIYELNSNFQYISGSDAYSFNVPVESTYPIDNGILYYPKKSLNMPHNSFRYDLGLLMTCLSNPQTEVDSELWQNFTLKSEYITELDYGENTHLYGLTHNYSQLDVPNHWDTQAWSSWSSTLLPDLLRVHADHVTYVPDYAFANCKNFIVGWFGNATEIGQYAFYGCKSIAIYNIFKKVTHIGADAFANTDINSISESDFPEVTDIENNIFDNCTRLTEINMPKLTAILKEFSSSSSSYEEPSFTSDSSSSIYVPHDVYFGRNLQRLHTLNLQSYDGEVPALPSSTMRKIILPSIKTIQQYEFYNFSSLSSLDLTSVQTAFSNAFLNCDKLSVLSLPNAINFVYGMFMSPPSNATATSYTYLSKILLPKVTNLDGQWTRSHNFFYLENTGRQKAYSIEEINLDSITEIPSGNPNNKYPGTPPQNENISVINEPVGFFQQGISYTSTEGKFFPWRYNPTLSSLSFQSAEIIRSYGLANLFNTSNGLTINLPSVSSIEDNAFYGNEISSLSLPSLTTFCKDAFNNMPSLNSLIAPNTSQGNGIGTMFRNCPCLEMASLGTIINPKQSSNTIFTPFEYWSSNGSTTEEISSYGDNIGAKDATGGSSTTISVANNSTDFFISSMSSYGGALGTPIYLKLPNAKNHTYYVECRGDNKRLEYSLNTQYKWQLA